jgi:hypothetical protein
MSRNHLTILAAAFALMAAPAFAQTNATTTSRSGADAGTSTSDETAPMPHGRTHAMHGYPASHAAGHGRGGTSRASSADHSADELNAQVLAAIQSGGPAPFGSGAGSNPSMGGSSAGMGGSSAGMGGGAGAGTGTGAAGTTGAGSGSTGTQR